MLPPAEGSSFSIGICATGNAKTLVSLLDAVEQEEFSDDLTLRRIVIAASGCTQRALAALKVRAAGDERILVLEESNRKGKAAAINDIIVHAVGEFIVFINSDAQPEKGSIAGLLKLLSSEKRAGIISASPYFDRDGSLISDVLDLMWSVHNDSSFSLNHTGMNNHASDELMVAKFRAIQRLPYGLVNDGAYMAGTAYLKGFSIRFSKEAKVKINVPRRLSDLIQQRRRIVFGHFQVWKWLGQSPRTVELMLFSTPRLSLRLIVRRVAQSPSLLRILPVALVSEALAFLLAIGDTLTATRRHAVWRRYGD